jgi:hypothetical protein
LQARRITAFQEDVGALLKIDFFFPTGAPASDAGSGTRAEKEVGLTQRGHSRRSYTGSPNAACTPDEIIVALVPNRNRMRAGSVLSDGDHLVGLGVLKVLLYELVAPLIVIGKAHQNPGFFAAVLAIPNWSAISVKVRRVTLFPSR